MEKEIQREGDPLIFRNGERVPDDILKSGLQKFARRDMKDQLLWACLELQQQNPRTLLDRLLVMIVEDCYDVRMLPLTTDLLTKAPGLDGPGCVQLAMLIHDARKLRLMSDLKRLTKRQDVERDYGNEFSDVFNPADTVAGSTAREKFVRLLRRKQDAALCWLPQLAGTFERPFNRAEVGAVWKLLRHEAGTGQPALVAAIRALELLYFRNGYHGNPLESFGLAKPARECLLYLYFAVSVLNRRDHFDWAEKLELMPRTEAEILCRDHRMNQSRRIPWWVMDMHTKAGRQRQRRVYGSDRAKPLAKIEFREEGALITIEDTRFKDPRLRALYHRTFDPPRATKSGSDPVPSDNAVSAAAPVSVRERKSASQRTANSGRSRRHQSRVQGTWTPTNATANQITPTSLAPPTQIKEWPTLQGTATTFRPAARRCSHQSPRNTAVAGTGANMPTAGHCKPASRAIPSLSSDAAAAAAADALSPTQPRACSANGLYLPTITWGDIKAVPNNRGLSGKGFSGTVFPVKFRGKMRCVKSLNTGDAQGHQKQRLMLEFDRECTAYAQLPPHPSLLCALGNGRDNRHNPFILLELAPHGSMKDMLRRDSAEALPEALVATVGHQIAAGLAHIHRAGYVFMDLHLGNVLVKHQSSSGLRVCLADFGCACHSSSPPTTWHGHRRLSPREVLERCYELPSSTHTRASPRKPRLAIQHAPSIDVFMFGRLLYEILAPRPSLQARPNFWPELTDMEIIARVLRRESPSMTTDRFRRFRTTIEFCWRDEATERPSAQQLCDLLAIEST